jgi:asparagine synthase (glutamine-hydrolysing)
MTSSSRYLHVKKTPAGPVARGDTVRTVMRDPVNDGSGIDGHSLVAGWRYEDGVVTVTADRLGLVPIYYYATADEILVSDKLSVISQEIRSLEIDFFAVYSFLKLSFYLGDSTPFMNVCRLRQGETVTWRDGVVDRRSALPAAGTVEGSDREIIERAQFLFQESIRKRIHADHKPVIPISGGRDSRHIMLELVRQHVAGLESVTVRYWDDYQEEVRLGALLSKTFSVPHTVLKKKFGHQFQTLFNQIRANDFESTTHLWVESLSDRYNDQSYLIYDGLGGADVMFMPWDDLVPGFGSPEFRPACRDKDAEKIAFLLTDGDYGVPSYLCDLWGPGKSFAARFAETLTREIARHAGAHDIVNSFMTDHRSRRAIGVAPMVLLGDHCSVSVPYFDQDLLDFSNSVSLEDRLRPDIHDRMIKTSYPEASHIEFENKSLRNLQLPAGATIRTFTQLFPYVIRAMTLPELRHGYVLSRYLVNALRMTAQPYDYIATSIVYALALAR